MFEFFFSADQPAAQVINSMILAITIMGLAQIAIAWWRGVRATDTAVDSLGAAGTPRDASFLLRQIITLQRSNPVRQRLELLQRFRQQKEPVDSEMLVAVTAESFRDAAPLARWAMSVLVLFGLGGTLIGLGMAVSNLSSLLTGSSPGTRQITDAILNTLESMGLAFSTTLAGVLGTILVASAMAALRHKQSYAMRKLEELSATEWAPLFQTTERSQFTDAVKELEKTREVLTGGLNLTISEVRIGFTQLSEAFHLRSTQLLGEVSRLRDATLEIIGERDENSLSLAQYVETVSATTAQLEASVRASGELLPHIQISLEATIQAEQRALADTLTAHTEAVRPILQKQEAAAQALNDAVTSELARLSEVKDVLERLNRSFEGARNAWEHADHAIERMGKETANALREGLQNTLEAVGRLTAEQSRSQERVTSAMDGFQTTYQETIRLLAEQSHRSLNQSQETVGEIRTTLREGLEKVGERLVDVQRGSSDRVAMSLNALARELRDLSRGPGVSAPRPRPSHSEQPSTLSSSESEALPPPGGTEVLPRKSAGSERADPLPSNIRKELEGLK